MRKWWRNKRSGVVCVAATALCILRLSAVVLCNVRLLLLLDGPGLCGCGCLMVALELESPVNVGRSLESVTNDAPLISRIRLEHWLIASDTFASTADKDKNTPKSKHTQCSWPHPGCRMIASTALSWRRTCGRIQRHHILRSRAQRPLQYRQASIMIFFACARNISTIENKTKHSTRHEKYSKIKIKKGSKLP